WADPQPGLNGRSGKAATPSKSASQATPQSARRRASNSAESSSAANSSATRAASASNTCSTTPISASLWNGRSTCCSETRLIDVWPQTGQRTASPTAPCDADGASSEKEEGNTGRGWFSG